MFKEINLRNYSSLHKLFYSLLLMDMVIVLHVLMVLKAIAWIWSRVLTVAIKPNLWNMNQQTLD